MRLDGRKTADMNPHDKRHLVELVKKALAELPNTRSPSDTCEPPAAKSNPHQPPEKHDITPPTVRAEPNPITADIGARNAPDSKQGWREKWKCRLEIAGAGVLTIYTFFTILIWCQTKRSVDNAQKQFELSERPWVGPVELLPGNFTVSGKPLFIIPGPPGATFGVFIANSGKVPALGIKFEINRRFLKSSEPFSATYESGPGTPIAPSISVIQPGMRMSISTIPMNRGLTVEEIHQLTSGEELLYVFGHIDYRDTNTHQHFTNFCFQMGRDLASMVTCTEYNEAT
jgi:hypothetical protein